MFKLSEDDDSHAILRYNKKPIFKGLVQIERIGSTEEASIEVYRFWKRTRKPRKQDITNPQEDFKKNLKPLDAKLFKHLVKNIAFLVVPAESDDDELEILFDLHHRIQGPEIRRYYMCKSCKKQKIFTLVDRNDFFLSRSKDKICKDCAGKEIFYILEKDIGIQISAQLKLIMGRLLLRFKSIPKIMQMMSPNFNPVKNSDLTIWDTQMRSEELVEKFNTTPPTLISNLPIPRNLKSHYITKKISQLLPIQIIAVNEGLFENKNLLVVSSTSSGKTLLGELSGFSKILNTGGTMIYAVPLVALANLRFEEYTGFRKYGIQPFLLIGGSFLRKRKNKGHLSSKTNLIVGTYEAIDAVIRSGQLKKEFTDVNTLVIDEIQMLSNMDRGYQLDGLIARLRYQYPNSQYIYLSATLSEAKPLAKHFSSKLIEFKGRPVPLERHLIMVLNEFEKRKILLELIGEEFKNRSSFGFRGQTLVFTNSRRKCEFIADFLNDNRVSAAAYHAGLTYEERIQIEDAFSTQRISCVVTTSALAAGVDFPASQVVFESLAMGINWLSVAEFEQMCGRAGRYGKHNQAKAIILCEPGRSYNAGQIDTEEKIALLLLKGKIETIFQEPDENMMFTEVLGFLCMKNRDTEKATMQDLRTFQDFMVNNDFSLITCISELMKDNFIEKPPRKAVQEFIPTKYGIACSSGFFTVDQCKKIRQSLESGKNLFDLVEKSDIEDQKGNLLIDLAIAINSFNNFYISNALINEIKSITGKTKTSTLLFSNQVLSLLHAETFDYKRKLPKFIKNLLLKWTQDLFTCSCSDNPYCECGRKTIQEKMIQLRLDGNTIDEIRKYFMDTYQIQVFRGDLYDFYDQIIYNLRTIYEIAQTIDVYNEIVADIEQTPTILTNLIG